MQDIHQNHPTTRRPRQLPVETLNTAASNSLNPTHDTGPWELTPEELRQIVADVLG